MAATPTSKAQRLVNLVIALMSTSAYLSADQIRRMVQGYEDCASEQSFLRMFERDKRELRDAGVPIDQGNALTAGSPTGYRISASDYQLPDMHITAEQAGVLGIAAEVWRNGERGAQAGDALAKLSAAGISPVATATRSVAIAHPEELSVAATLAEAVSSALVVTFEHTAAGASDSVRRRLEPWWTGSRDGHWYVVGFDLDRDAPRTFRLVRTTDVTVTQQRRTRPVPSSIEVSALLETAITRFNPLITSRIWAAPGHAAELRARALSSQASSWKGRKGDVLTVRGPLSELCAQVAGQAGFAVAIEPEQLRERVLAVLTAAAGGQQ